MNRILSFLGTFVSFFVLGVLTPLSVFAAEASEFVLLTGNDGPLATGIEPSSLPGFLNNLYTILIGVAVVLAILQIIRGGIMWMLTDSVTEKGHASHLVTIAVMGLVLILSPVVVFNIINPKILNLDISEGLAELKKGLPDTSAGTTPPAEEDPIPLPQDGKTIEQPGTVIIRGYSSSEAVATAWEASQRDAGRIAYAPRSEHRCAKRDTSNKCISFLSISSNVARPLYVFAITKPINPGLGQVYYSHYPVFFYGTGNDLPTKCLVDGGIAKKAENIDDDDSLAISKDKDLVGVDPATCPANIATLRTEYNVPEDSVLRTQYSVPQDVQVTACMAARDVYCQVNG